MFTTNKKTQHNDVKQQAENTNNYKTFITKLLASAFATFFGHPWRVALNEASVNTNPVKTFKSAYYKMFHDAHINLLRGTSSTTLQLLAENRINLFFGHDTYMGRIAGLFGTVVAGVAVTPIEIYFMRQNTLRTASAAIIQNPPKFFNQADSICGNVKIKSPILAFFAARELGFCLSVFGAKNLDFYQKIPILLMSALITAIAHKLAAIEITKHIRQIEDGVPDYRIGYRAVFRNIAYGNVYLHESFRVPFKNPKTTSQLARNFFTATCGPNMYSFRLLYLAVFSSLLSFANEGLSRVEIKKQVSEEEVTASVTYRRKSK